MGLSGLEIYKLLPKTNCKKCGFQTCLAFAMQLAKKAIAVDKCPFVSADARAILEKASLPAIRQVEIGAGDYKTIVGNETVLFRHEEKFRNPIAIGIIIEDEISAQDLDKTLKQIAKLNFERVGQNIGVNLVALKNKSGNKEKFILYLQKIKQQSSLGIVLMTQSQDTLKEALKICADVKPLVCSQSLENIDAVAILCKEYKVPLSFRADTLEDFSATTNRITQQGLTDIVLDIPEGKISQRLWQLTQMRRLAIKKSERGLGFPSMVIIDTADERQASTEAITYIAKYASIVLLKTTKPEYILPLLTFRQNIFTDPQKPLQVEPGVYPIGNAGEKSPVLITTNFSLTYYTVLGEVESSRVPVYLICVDTEGMSVLTAWAADKFSPEIISDTLTRFKLAEKVSNKNLIIPGYVALMSGDLEEKTDWKITVGPREASGIPSFLKSIKNQ